MDKNGKKLWKIANNCKISEITKYGEKNTKNGNRFSDSKLPQKMVLAVFTRCLVPEIQIFGHFWLKSAFVGPNFSRTEICTAKPMVVGCVQHYSIHFVKELGKLSESFFRQVQKNAKNGKKWRF